MNVFEMLSFDFQEFVTSPAGILIIVGIVFLLVGIVIFLKEGKKATKPVEVIKEDIKPVEAQPTLEEVKTPEVTPVTPVVEPVIEEKPVIVKATEDGVNEVPVPTVANTLNIEGPKPAVVEPVEEVKVETLDTTPVAVSTPVVEAPVPAAPVVEAPTPAVETLEPAQPTVYGGVSPEVKNVTIEEKPREIYGGANPLENTAPIPTAAVNTAIQTPAAVYETPVVPSAPVVEAPTPTVPVVEAPAPVAPVVEAPKEEIEKLEF